MEIVLLENIGRLGAVGSVVTVKDGYARNFLLPQQKALRATKANLAFFEAEKSKLEKLDQERKKQAEKTAKVIDGKTVVVIRAASESGQLYGSVTTRDIAESASSLGETVDRSQVRINQSYKMLGLYDVVVELHPEVTAQITINIARSEEEAVAQEKAGKEAVKAEQEAIAAEEAALAAAAAAKAEEATAEETVEEAPAEEDAA